MQGLLNFAPVSTRFLAIETEETLSPKEFVIPRPTLFPPATERKVVKRKLEKGKLTRALERDIQERAHQIEDEEVQVSGSTISRCIALAGFIRTFDRRHACQEHASISSKKLQSQPP
jgi:hypothetical protein